MKSAKVFKFKLKVGDTVMVRAGKYKGRSGKITAVHPSSNMVTVEGLNIIKRHRKPSQRHPQGTIVETSKPLPAGKVGVLDIAAKKPSRIGYKTSQAGKKTRILKSSGLELK